MSQKLCTCIRALKPKNRRGDGFPPSPRLSRVSKSSDDNELDNHSSISHRGPRAEELKKHLGFFKSKKDRYIAPAHQTTTAGYMVEIDLRRGFVPDAQTTRIPRTNDINTKVFQSNVSSIQFRKAIVERTRTTFSDPWRGGYSDSCTIDVTGAAPSRRFQSWRGCNGR